MEDLIPLNDVKESLYGCSLQTKAEILKNPLTKTAIV